MGIAKALQNDTIAAIATPPGRGGVGIIRISGPETLKIAEKLLSKKPLTRYATFCDFLDDDKTIIDQGVAICFVAPHSFTGEDVLELQGHGGPVILDCLLNRVLKLGARIANPGEFSERAFLNGKINLTEAEAICDLINAATTASARSAVNSLRGEFSKKIEGLLKIITGLRVYIELAIDFSDEDISFLENEQVNMELQKALTKLNDIEATTKQGVLLQEGITIVIAGKPNVGKSSLLNLLSGEDRAIVTEIPGTTRDILSSQIQLDGLPLHLLDTAGLRATSDIIEQEGVKRAWNAINKADHLLLLFDASSETTRNPKELLIDFFKQLPETVKCTVVFNKIDLTHEKECITEIGGFNCLFISLKTRSGIELLKDHLKKSVGFSCLNGSIYSARRRHLEALSETKKYLLNATNSSQSKTFEFMAEDLRLAQEKLGEITGKFTTEDLLNKIFSEFCVGK